MSAVAQKGTILKNEWVNSEYKHMIIQVSLEASTVEPGQFFNLLCPQSEGAAPFFRRPMSTYLADSQKQQLEFLYKIVGKGTKGLGRLKEGEQLDFVGPLGRGFTLEQTDRHILLLGRGVGLATLAPLAEFAAAHNIHVSALLSAKTAEHVLSRNRFEAINADIIELLDTDGSSDVDEVRKTIIEIHQTRPIDTVFTCGSNRLAKLLQSLLEPLNLKGQIALEQNMACGTGICHGCIVTEKQNDNLVSRQVCKDGPVFNLKDIVL